MFLTRFAGSHSIKIDYDLDCVYAKGVVDGVRVCQ